MNTDIKQFIRRAKQLCEQHRHDALRFASAMDKVFYEDFDRLTAEEADIIEAAFLQIAKADVYDQMLRAALSKTEEAHG